MDMGINVGKLNGASISFSTWNWLKAGISVQRQFGPLSGFYLTSLFLQPEFNVSEHYKLFAKCGDGIFQDRTWGTEFGATWGLTISGGVNYYFANKWYIDCEMGYLRANVPSVEYNMPNTLKQQPFLNVGLHYLVSY